MSEIGQYKVPTNVVKIPKGDTGYNLVKNSYRRFIWTWNQAPENRDDDHDPKEGKPKKLKHLKESEELVAGGLASGKSIKDIADMHGVSVEHIESQLYKGIKVEVEHTPNVELAEEIAKDHLIENPNYYDYLEDMEKDMESKDDVEESTIGDNVWNNVDTKEISGMGRSDQDWIPGGTVGYKSGPLSKKNKVMPSHWFVDPDDTEEEERKLRNLKQFDEYFNSKTK